jgi:hypothetical protein
MQKICTKYYQKESENHIFIVIDTILEQSIATRARPFFAITIFILENQSERMIRNYAHKLLGETYIKWNSSLVMRKICENRPSYV